MYIFDLHILNFSFNENHIIICHLFKPSRLTQFCFLIYIYWMTNFVNEKEMSKYFHRFYKKLSSNAWKRPTRRSWLLSLSRPSGPATITIPCGLAPLGCWKESISSPNHTPDPPWKELLLCSMVATNTKRY